MKIQVLGSGCPTCKKLHDLTMQVASEIDPAIKVEYITGNNGIQKIIELGAMSSPVLVVDGQVVMVGFTPDKEKLKDKITRSIKA